MNWCSQCLKIIDQPDRIDGKICCTLCGRVIGEYNFSNEREFVKNAAGQSQLSGTFVKTVQNERTVSKGILNEAYGGIDSKMSALQIDGGDSIALPGSSRAQL